MIDEDESMPPYYYNNGIAELIGVPADIDMKKLARAFPFMNKQMHFANLDQKEILDIKDDLYIKNILQRSKMTRGEKTRLYDRAEFIDIRAYLTAGLSLSRDGFLTKRITGAYKNVQMSDGSEAPQKRRGMLGGLFKGGNDE